MVITPKHLHNHEVSDYVQCLGVITCLVRFNFVNNMLFLWYENYLWTQIHVAIDMCHTQNQHLGIYEQHFFLQ